MRPPSNWCIAVKEPINGHEFEDYYYFRWKMLRAPWHQAQGSEKDEFEAVACHQMACLQDGEIVGVGRLHQAVLNEDGEKLAQVRYMAVSPDYQRHGIGAAILNALEETAMQWRMQTILLNSRESAVGFYQRQGYQVIVPSHLLYGEIQHYEMRKAVTPQ